MRTLTVVTVPSKRVIPCSFKNSKYVKVIPLNFKNQATVKLPGSIFLNNIYYFVEQAHSVLMSGGGS